MRKSTVSALKNFSFGYFIHSLVIEFSPLVVFVVFDVVEVMTSVCIALVNADGMKVVDVLVILNILENVVYFLVQ